MTFSTTPSVFKGIYIVFLLILITSYSFAQVTKKDTSTFNKWEVSLDLKPLFRKDESYNLFIKRYLTERKVIRLGLGVLETETKFSQEKGVAEAISSTPNRLDTFNYFQSQLVGNNPNISYQYQLNGGFQYFLSKKRVSIYLAVDIFYTYQTKSIYYPTLSAIISKNNIGTFSGTETFEGYDPTYKFDEYSKTYGSKLGIGLDYGFNQSLSLSMEVSISYQRTIYNMRRIDKPYPDQRYDKFFNDDSDVQKIKFNPLVGLFFNYHF